ncbi:hypothetical protein [Frigidibacter sp. MR17.24]|uniref:hypothetical protein n=1 Tax=Frigidibacter sp. MR17.24 TaxID=3127345 RepID=UPI0030130BEE
MVNHAAIAIPDEISALREELRMRIRLQNALLQGAVALFVPFAITTALRPGAAWICAFGFAVVMLALGLQWCHHGIRIRQIKQYLLLCDTRPQGWERWLPANRPDSLLGSRWMISTKGVLLGLGLAQAALAAHLDPQVPPLLVAGVAALWVTTCWFLVTNPKE